MPALTCLLHAAQLLRLAPNEHVLLLVTPRSVADAMSTTSFLSELAAAYSALLVGQQPQWAPMPVQCAFFPPVACMQSIALTLP